MMQGYKIEMHSDQKTQCIKKKKKLFSLIELNLTFQWRLLYAVRIRIDYMWTIRMLLSLNIFFFNKNIQVTMNFDSK